MAVPKRCSIHDKVYTEQCPLCAKGQGPAENHPMKNRLAGDEVKQDQPQATRRPVPVRPASSTQAQPQPGRRVISSGK